MTLAGAPDIPPAWLPLLAKILTWYDNQIYPVWNTFGFKPTRKRKRVDREKSYLRSIASYWAELNQAAKDAWHDASDFGTLNRYQLFTSDLSYRRKNGLSLPGTPNDFHQLFGLRMYNPSGLTNVRARRDEKDLTGPITISYSFLKTENAPTGDQPFKFVAMAYYFDAGKIKTLTHEWSTGAGNKAWQSVSEQFGVAGQKYFHLTVIWSIDGYDAIVDIDRLLIADQNGDKYRESWQFRAGRTWDYDALYRKTGWLFVPEYHVPYFDVVYLE